MSATFKDLRWMGSLRAAIFAMAWCACMAAAPSGASASQAQLTIKKFTLQTTRSVELPGTREKLKNATSGQPADFEHENYGFENVAVPFTQAGGHPNGQGGGADALTYTTEFEHQAVGTESNPAPTRDPKDIAVSLPSGLLGNPTAVPRCPLNYVLAFGIPCPASTQVGVAVVYLGGEGLVGPIVNVVPEVGQSAEFAIETNHKINFLMTGHVVRTEDPVTKQSEYGLTVVSNGITNLSIYKVELTYWGVPAAEIHDPERGLFCGRLSSPTSQWSCGFIPVVGGAGRAGEWIGFGYEKSNLPEVPFLSMAGNCPVGPEQAVMKADSW